MKVTEKKIRKYEDERRKYGENVRGQKIRKWTKKKAKKR